MEFDKIHQVVIDVISDNMASLVQSDKYVAIDTSDTTTNGYYAIRLISEAYMLQNNTTIDRQITTAGELVVNAKYICSMQYIINWYF